MTGVPYDRTLDMLRVGVFRALAYKHSGLTLANVRFVEHRLVCYPRLIVDLPTGTIVFEVPLGNVFTEAEIAEHLIPWTLHRIAAIEEGEQDPHLFARKSVKSMAFAATYGKGSPPATDNIITKIVDYAYSGEKHPNAGDDLTVSMDVAGRALTINAQNVNAEIHAKLAREIFGDYSS